MAKKQAGGLHYARTAGTVGPQRLKLPRPGGYRPIRTAGPRGLQRALVQQLLPPWWQPPPSWTGSTAEYACDWGHKKLGLVEGINYSRQGGFFGGHKLFGGLVVDFLEYDVPVAINVQGIFVHYRRGSGQIMRDLVSKAALARYGLLLVAIDETYLRADPVTAVREARMGIDRSLGTHL